MFSGFVLRGSAAAALLVVSVAVIGCSSSKETASRDTLTKDVGAYSPAPQGVTQPRVGVPPFNVTTNGGFMQGGDLNTIAADQATTLLDNTGRFRIIERAQLQKLLDEQNLEGVVKPGELAKTGQVRGVDYLLLGKVTNLRVKKEQKGNNFGLAQVGNLVGGADVKNKQVDITTECGVDIRLVDPSSGELMVSNFSEYKRTDSAKSMGLDILGANAESSADINITEDDKGKILRLALDDAIKKSLPKIDKFLRNQPKKSDDATAMPTHTNATGGAPANVPPAGNSAVSAPDAGAGTDAAVAKKFCPHCGKPVAAGAKFCPSCGEKIE